MEGKLGWPPSPRIFVSYRRADASGYAGRIYDALVERFGDDRVFMDVDDIHPGRDFAEVLAEALDRTGVLLVIIGPTWAVRQGLRRHRRLDNRRDYVRIELMAAMERGIGVVPVLLPNARMPSEQQLPQALAPLATIQAIELSDRRWKPDMRALIRLLETQAPGVPIGRSRATAAAAAATMSESPPSNRSIGNRRSGSVGWKASGGGRCGGRSGRWPR